MTDFSTADLVNAQSGLEGIIKGWMKDPETMRSVVSGAGIDPDEFWTYLNRKNSGLVGQMRPQSRQQQPIFDSTGTEVVASGANLIARAGMFVPQSIMDIEHTVSGGIEKGAQWVADQVSGDSPASRIKSRIDWLKQGKANYEKSAKTGTKIEPELKLNIPGVEGGGGDYSSFEQGLSPEYIQGRIKDFDKEIADLEVKLKKIESGELSGYENEREQIDLRRELLAARAQVDARRTGHDPEFLTQRYLESMDRAESESTMFRGAGMAGDALGMALSMYGGPMSVGMKGGQSLWKVTESAPFWRKAMGLGTGMGAHTLATTGDPYRAMLDVAMGPAFELTNIWGDKVFNYLVGQKNWMKYVTQGGVSGVRGRMARGGQMLAEGFLFDALPQAEAAALWGLAETAGISWEGFAERAPIVNAIVQQGNEDLTPEQKERLWQDALLEVATSAGAFGAMGYAFPGQAPAWRRRNPELADSARQEAARRLDAKKSEAREAAQASFAQIHADLVSPIEQFGFKYQGNGKFSRNKWGWFQFNLDETGMPESVTFSKSLSNILKTGKVQNAEGSDTIPWQQAMEVIGTIEAAGLNANLNARRLLQFEGVTPTDTEGVYRVERDPRVHVTAEQKMSGYMIATPNGGFMFRYDKGIDDMMPGPLRARAYKKGIEVHELGADGKRKKKKGRKVYRDSEVLRSEIKQKGAGDDQGGWQNIDISNWSEAPYNAQAKQFTNLQAGDMMASIGEQLLPRLSAADAMVWSNLTDWASTPTFKDWEARQQLAQALQDPNILANLESNPGVTIRMLARMLDNSNPQYVAQMASGVGQLAVYDAARKIPLGGPSGDKPADPPSIGRGTDPGVVPYTQQTGPRSEPHVSGSWHYVPSLGFPSGAEGAFGTAYRQTKSGTSDVKGGKPSAAYDPVGAIPDAGKPKDVATGMAPQTPSGPWVKAFHDAPASKTSALRPEAEPEFLDMWTMDKLRELHDVITGAVEGKPKPENAWKKKPVETEPKLSETEPKLSKAQIIARIAEAAEAKKAMAAEEQRMSKMTPEELEAEADRMLEDDGDGSGLADHIRPKPKPSNGNDYKGLEIAEISRRMDKAGGYEKYLETLNPVARESFQDEGMGDKVLKYREKVDDQDILDRDEAQENDILDPNREKVSEAQARKEIESDLPWSEMSSKARIATIDMLDKKLGGEETGRILNAFENMDKDAIDRRIRDLVADSEKVMKAEPLDLEAMKAKDMTTLLKELGLKSSGRRDEKLQRLKEHFAKAKGNLYAFSPMFQLQEQAMQAMSQRFRELGFEFKGPRSEAEKKAYDQQIKRAAEIQVAEFRAAQDFAQLMRDVPDKKAREDLTAYIQKDGNPLFGDGDTFDQVSSRLSAEHKALADRIRTRLEETFNVLLEARYLEPDQHIENYIPQVYQRPDARTLDRVVRSINTLRKDTPYNKSRLYQTYMEAFKQAGLKPKSMDIAVILREYESMARQAAANQAFVETLKMQGILVSRNDAERMTPNHTFEFNHPAGRDGENGYLVGHMDARRVLEGVIDMGLDRKDMGRNLNKLINHSKALTLSFSGFHFFSLAESMMQSARFTPVSGLSDVWKALRQRKALVDTVGEDWIRSGLTLANELDNTQSPLSKDLESLITNLRMKDSWVAQAGAKVAGVVKKALEVQSKYLWEVTHNAFKLYRAESEFARLSEKHADKINSGEMTMDEIRRQIAYDVNDMFGGQNWEAYLSSAAHKSWRQRASMVLLAPDWTLSNIRIAGKAIGSVVDTGPTGSLRRRYLANSLVMMAFLGTAMNYMMWPLLSEEDRKKFMEEGGSLNGWADGFDIDHLTSFFVGYDDKGRAQYAKPLKQVTEVLRWFTDPKEIFGSKLAPLTGEVIAQLSGHHPGSEFPAPFSAEAEGVKRSFYETLGLRAWSVMQNFLPLTMGGLTTNEKTGEIEWRGNQWMMILPKRSETTASKLKDEMVVGLTKYASEAAEALKAGKEADWGPYLEKLEVAIEKGYRNNVQVGKTLQTAVGALRANLYEEMLYAINQGDTSAAENAAAKLAALGARRSNVRSSLRDGFMRLMRENDALFSDQRKAMQDAMRMVPSGQGRGIRRLMRDASREDKARDRRLKQESDG